ncbi:MAG TPA: YggS family pyridoxal phosphate-dependent enzyme [Flavitalea sp.]|nr:YggS family pyridoxal phosphate-dependent enzyme [Flavitalea sp.]
MAVNKQNYKLILDEVGPAVQLVAVSKLQSAADIQELYNLGQLDFGENYVQELLQKQAELPAGIRWHFIGHLQSNKVKFIAPFVHLVHGVDSLKLLQEINKQGRKLDRIIHCLLQVHIATEESKFGLNAAELQELVNEVTSSGEKYNNVFIDGLMGMASFSDNINCIESEFQTLQQLFQQYSTVDAPNVRFSILSMGMSGDFKTALKYGSTMVRIGSLLFGPRVYSK